MPTSAIVDVNTEQGPGRLLLSIPDTIGGLMVLGGGASGQVETAELTALAELLPGQGWLVARYELPWRVAGRKIGPRPPASDPLWQTGVAMLRDRWPAVPLVTGGRSAGARIACRTWTPGLAGIVALSFPLHAPGKPVPTRLPELQPVGVPVLLVSGSRDPYGKAEEWTDTLAAPHAGPRELVIIPGAAHSFPASTVPGAVAAVARFLDLRFESGLG